MFRWSVTGVIAPGSDQQEGRKGRPADGLLPSEGGHEPRDHWRRHGGTEAEAQAQCALYQRPLLGFEPGCDDACLHREERTLGQAEQQLEAEEGGEQCGSTEHEGGEGRAQRGDESEQSNHDERDPGAQSLS